jgi:hypothetical protein
MLAVAAQLGTHLAQLGITDGDRKTGKRRAISACVLRVLSVTESMAVHNKYSCVPFWSGDHAFRHFGVGLWSVPPPAQNAFGDELERRLAVAALARDRLTQQCVADRLPVIPGYRGTGTSAESDGDASIRTSSITELSSYVYYMRGLFNRLARLMTLP